MNENRQISGKKTTTVGLIFSILAIACWFWWNSGKK